MGVKGGGAVMCGAGFLHVRLSPIKVSSTRFMNRMRLDFPRLSSRALPFFHHGVFHRARAMLLWWGRDNAARDSKTRNDRENGQIDWVNPQFFGLSPLAHPICTSGVGPGSRTHGRQGSSVDLYFVTSFGVTAKVGRTYLDPTTVNDRRCTRGLGHVPFWAARRRQEEGRRTCPSCTP